MLVFAVLLGVVLGTTGVGVAWWGSSGSGGATAAATGVPVPGAPAVSVTGREVVVSWAVVAMPGGVPVSGYTVRRSTNGQAATVVAACSGTATSCTDTAVPVGTSTYTVTAQYGPWTGAASASASVTVAAPVLTLPTSTSSLPATLTGTLANALPGAPLSFRLDNATTGTVLSGTPSIVAPGASTAVSVVLPTGTATGAHTVYAIAGAEQASAPVSVAVNGAPGALTWVSNGDGRARAGDVLRVSYSQPLDLASLDPSDPDGNVNVVVTLTNAAGASGNDLLTVTAVGGANVAFGTIDLGSNAFVVNAITFGASGTPSTLVWNAADRTLTLTLGTESNSSAKTLATPVTATYAPAAGLRTSTGGFVTGTISTTGLAF